jgi:glutamate--cysteine ligase catalytic subunit
MRKFVHAHPAYKQDSVISPEIAHDLLMTCQGIGEGVIPCPDLLGDITIERLIFCIYL